MIKLIIFCIWLLSTIFVLFYMVFYANKKQTKTLGWVSFIPPLNIAFVLWVLIIRPIIQKIDAHKASRIKKTKKPSTE